MTHEEILKVLRQEVLRARENARIAYDNFDVIVNDCPSGLPHPDGSLRVRRASAEYIAARSALTLAMSREDAFVLEGTVPEHFKKVVERQSFH